MKECISCHSKVGELLHACPNCGGTTFIQTGSGQDALSMLDAMQKQDEAKQYVDRGAQFFMQGRYAEAEKELKIAIKINPMNATAYGNIGGIFLKQGRYEEAIPYLEKALELNPRLEGVPQALSQAKNKGKTAAQKLAQPKSSQSISASKPILSKRLLVGVAGIVVILSVIAGLGFILMFGRDYLGQKNTVIFEPDYSKISTSVDSSVLEKTAEILTTRAKNLGYFSISFVVNGDGQIVGKIPSYIDTNAFVKKISQIGLLEFVDFGKTPLPKGAVISTDYKSIYIQQTGDKQWHTIMTNENIGETSVAKSQMGKFQISFSLTNNGRKTFADYTTANIGTYLAIVLDKVILSMPMINSAITDGNGIISGDFTQESAQDLAAILKTTPLPIPIKLVQSADSAK